MQKSKVKQYFFYLSTGYLLAWPLPLTCLALFNFSLQTSTTAGQTRMTVLQQWQTWLIIIIITFAKVLQIFGKPININQLQLKAPPHTHTQTESRINPEHARTFTSGERVLDSSRLPYSCNSQSGKLICLIGRRQRPRRDQDNLQ